MTFAAVGSSFGGNPGATTFSLTPNTVGDLILVEVTGPGGSTVLPTSMSSSNVTWATFGSSFTGSTNTRALQVFAGTVTSTSTATVTVGWGGTSPGTMHYAGQEFSSTVGAWALDVQGHIDSAGQTTWASLTPAAAGELYFGFANNDGNAVSGSTSGYTYNANVDGTDNGMAYNAACTSSAQAPVWADTGQAIGIMVLVKETSSGTTANAGLAAGTGTAQSPVPGVTPAAALAAGAGTSQSPKASVAANPGLATAAGTSQQPVPDVIPAAGLAAGTGTALQPTVNTSGSTTANAGLATGAGTAQAPVPVVTPGAGLAAGTGTAQQPAITTGITVPAGLATAAGTAQQPSAAITATAGLAAGTGTALQPSFSAGTLYEYIGQEACTYLDYLDTGTGRTLSPVPGNSYSMVVASGRNAALTVPPPGRPWNPGNPGAGGTFAPLEMRGAPLEDYAVSMARGRAHNAAVHAAYARGILRPGGPLSEADHQRLGCCPGAGREEAA